MLQRNDPFDGQMSLEDVQSLAKQDARSSIATTTSTISDVDDDVQAKPQQDPMPTWKAGRTLTGAPADLVVINPDIKPITEEKEKHAVFAYGRFNPPTIGHEKLIHATEKVASEHKVPAHIIASHTEGNSKNPVPTKAKVGYLKKVAAKTTKVSSSDKESPNLLTQAANLHKHGTTHLHMVAGSDRVEEYHKLLHKYNGTHEGALYNFKKITVHSAGHRDPDAEGAEGMSGTKMRAAAKSGDHKTFKSGLPKALHPHAEEISNHVRSVKESMGEFIADDLYLEEGASLKTRMKRAQNMRKNKTKMARARDLARKRFAKSIALRRRALKKARQVVRRKLAGERGMEYNKLSMSSKIALDKMVDKRKGAIIKIANKITPRIKRDELSRLHSAMKGTKPTSSPAPFVAEDMSVLISEKAAIALQKKADKNGVDLNTLQQVFARGMTAFKNTNPPGVTPQQWAFSRVNSYLAKGKAFEHDKDLREAEMTRDEKLQKGMNTARNMKMVSFKTLRQVHGTQQQKDIEVDLSDDSEHESSRKKADIIRRRTNQLKDKILEHANKMNENKQQSALAKIASRFNKE